ncbi:THAP domain-containing protein 1-like isoform X2 [Leguminivora glycinivorella]|uniref:THAP domain-containing protein 1-like isoform X2 n=1 Tax=Leguminivora glycinivorella TaxID=1035111 RepID=UPI0020106494|nr:THAP domain-containing protein 1-like isoform X2 [Leguminivora glycinivorella]
MVGCAVNGCYNTTNNNKKPSDITFHAFPIDPLLAAKWTEKIRLNRNDATWKPTKHSRICSVHFDEGDKYESKNGLRKLCRGTVPTKNVPVFITEEKRNDPCNILNQHGPSSPQRGTSRDDANKTQLKSPSLSSTSIASSIFDSPKEASLRQKLKRKVILQRKLTKKIKFLQQKTRRLTKRNESLQNIIKELRKKRSVNNDVCNVLSEKVQQAEQYKTMALEKTTANKQLMPECTPVNRY